jgi:hypothetical protein
MEQLKLQAPQPSFDITFSVMKAMQGIFAGAMVELAFCKSISRQFATGLCILVHKRDGIDVTNTMGR